MSTLLNKLKKEINSRTAAMFPKLPRYNKTEQAVASFLSDVGAPDSVRKALRAITGTDFRDVRVTPTVGAMVFVSGKDGGRRHGHALFRPALVAKVHDNGEISVVKFHSGNVLNSNTLRPNEYRAAKSKEVESFLKANWGTTRKKDNTLAALGISG